MDKEEGGRRKGFLFNINGQGGRRKGFLLFSHFYKKSKKDTKPMMRFGSNKLVFMIQTQPPILI